MGTALEENLCTGPPSRMRISSSNMKGLAFFLWPTLGLIQMDPSSFCAQQPVLGWMASMVSFRSLQPALFIGPFVSLPEVREDGLEGSIIP